MSVDQQPKFHCVGNQDAVINSGKGLVFVIDSEKFFSGFVIRFNHKLYAYRNQCPHTGSELDWVMGQFFEERGEMLICSTHGAIFNPINGKCINGPCVNQSLISIPIKLDSDKIFAYY